MSPRSRKRPRIVSLSEDCLLIQFDGGISDETHTRVMEICRAFSESPLPHLKDIVPAYSSVALFFDRLKQSRISFSQEGLIASIEERISSITPDKNRETSRDVISIPTRFGGSSGRNLKEIAMSKGMTESDFIDRFTSETYKVFMIGFRPGFPYMGTVPKELASDRLQTPRAMVPAGSVGIAGRQTGIYPMDSPGGWQIVGKTDLKLLDIGNEDSPTFFQTGDLVRFVAI